MKTITTNTKIPVPVDVATCPACDGKLTVEEVDSLVEQDDGKYMAESVFPSCENDEDYRLHEYTYDMPYVYWLPVVLEIEAWVNEKFRFVWE